MFSKIRLAVLAAGILVPIGAAAPAFASSNPQTVNVSVNSVISITGLSNVSFTGNPGTTAPGVGTTSAQCSSPALAQCTESYTVTSNDGAGYTLAESAFAATFSGPGPANVLPDTDWSITAEANGVGGTIKTISPTTTAQTVYSTTSGPSTDTIGEEWTLALPSNLPAGSFTNQLTYLASGN